MKVLYGVLLMLSIRGSVYSQELLTAISEITPKLTTNIGSTAYLTCTVFHPMKYNISWIKVDNEMFNKSVVLTFGNYMLAHDSRYSLRQDIISTKHFYSNCYTLQIKNIHETDAGVYGCHVLIQPNETISADTEIDVQMPPTIFNVTRSLLIASGRPLKLECYAKGSPKPNVTWSRQGDAILVTGKSVHRGEVLEFIAIKGADRGLYRCSAENGIGKNAHHTIDVKVEFSPLVTTSRPFQGQSLTHYADLDCHVEGYPTPSVVWLHNGVELFNNQYYTITTVASSESVINSTLRTYIIEKHINGMYICKASNILGTKEAVIIIHESIKPTCPPACN